MTADTIRSHELDSLRDKLAALHRKRRSATAERPAPRKSDRAASTPEAHGLHGEILEFVRLIATYGAMAAFDGGLLQFIELAAWGYLALAFYVVFEGCLDGLLHRIHRGRE